MIMKQWILSVGIIVLLTSMVSLILPEGKIGKFIKAMFSLIKASLTKYSIGVLDSKSVAI